MTKAIVCLTIGFSVCLSGCAANNAEQAKQSEWISLFDGTNTDAWRGHNAETVPAKWKIENGLLVFEPSAEGSGGDLVTKDEYGDFEFELEFKITEGANSGIKYFVVEEMSKGRSGLGLEYQILDDQKHPDAKMGINGNRMLGSLYDLIAPDKNKQVNSIGQWNKARIVSRGKHVEHWLNGQKVLEFERGSEDFMKRIAQSKYKDIAGFGLAEKGHILLQDHGNKIYFRSIRIRNVAMQK